VPSGGQSPRHFRLVDAMHQLVVAHEKDGILASFFVSEDGRLTPSGAAIRVPGACYVLETGR
jgi:6-phosphogluconolactonase (cycloisomerase 2 family)